MSNYTWTWWESVTYDWPDWTRPWLAPPRWRNPTCDVTTRRVDETRVTASEPRQWPVELAGLNLTCDPPRQTPWQGSVGGGPIQTVDPTMTRRFTIDNKWGGNLYRDGQLVGRYGPGERWQVDVPMPVRNGWAVEGYPNALNQGDRHWFGIEPDGTAHECIWLGLNNTPTMLNYCKYAPDGTLLTGMPGGVVKGGQQWTRLAWDRFDEPHRLGIVFHNLGGGDGTGPPALWDFPRYGQTFRLSTAEYRRQLSLGVDPEQLAFLNALHFHGAEAYDRGGQRWHGSIGMVAGAQWLGSKLGELQIPLSSLELVTGETP